jgi:hypothetical protein
MDEIKLAGRSCSTADANIELVGFNLTQDEVAALLGGEHYGWQLFATVKEGVVRNTILGVMPSADHHMLASAVQRALNNRYARRKT